MRRLVGKVPPRVRGAVAALALAVAGAVALDALFPLPLPDDGDTSSVVADRDGRPLRAFASMDGAWRFETSEERVAPDYLAALFAFEDQYFYRHPGVNPGAMLRALGQSIEAGRVVSGASTLTMQVARILDPHPRSITGKLSQVFRALQLEWYLDKRGILALYLNRAPFGGSVQGVEAASFAYLGKSAQSLSLAEAALLVALPQAPSRLRPDRHPDAARTARDKVLRRMADLGRISTDEAAAAMQEPVEARSLEVPMWAPHLAQRLHAEHPHEAVLRTTIDLELQMALESRLRDYFQPLARRVSGALLVMDNRDGAVLAYVGGVTFGDRLRAGHVDLVRAPRSPGSTLKPFIYGLALDEGFIHSQSLLLDVPLSFADYSPQNFDRRFSGAVAAANALVHSLNVPAVQLLERISAERFAARLEHAGLPLALPGGGTPNLSLALGGGASTLEALVGAHSALANAGLAQQPRYLLAQRSESRRLLSEGAAWIVRDMLREPSHPFMSWKTGTSFGYRDAWALGSTADYTVGVWIGRPDGTPMPGSMGADTALPLLRQVLLSLPRRALAESRPASVAQVEICWPLGRAVADTPAELCAQRHSALVLEGRIPPTLAGPGETDGWMPVVDFRVDAYSGQRLSLGCAPGEGTPMQLARWPRELGPWLDPSLARLQTLPARRSDCAMDALDELDPLRIVGLPAEARLRALPGASRAPSASLQALGSGAEVRWLVDGALAATLPSEQRFVHAFAQRGPVDVVAVAEHGRFARLHLVVE